MTTVSTDSALMWLLYGTDRGQSHSIASPAPKFRVSTQDFRAGSPFSTEGAGDGTVAPHDRSPPGPTPPGHPQGAVRNQRPHARAPQGLRGPPRVQRGGQDREPPQPHR